MPVEGDKPSWERTWGGARSFVPTEGPRDGDVAYVVGGRSDGVTVVLLHSLGADGRMWDDCAGALAQHYRLVVPDARGHGMSEPAVDVTVETWVEDLRRVLADSETDRAILVGVSLGGIQAIAFAAAYPQMVRAIVVADSFASLPDEVAAAKIDELCTQARDEPMERVADHYLAATFEQPYPRGAEAVRHAIAGMDRDSYLEAVTACFGVQIDHCLPRVAAPTLVVWGDRDAKTPRALSERIVDGISGARFEVVADAGHLSNIDNPEGFTREVITFITRSIAQPGQRSDAKGARA